MGVASLTIFLLAVPIAISPARAQNPAPGYAVSVFAHGFATGSCSVTSCTEIPGCSYCVGPVGLASDPSGVLYVADIVSGNIYRFGPSPPPGGWDVSSATPFISNSTIGFHRPHGMAFDNGTLYLNLADLGEVVKLDLVNHSLGHVVTSGIFWPSGLAADPDSGDLFVSQSGQGNTIYRVYLTAQPGHPVGSNSPFATVPLADGLAFSPDGTLYAAAGGLGGDVAIDRKGNGQPINSISAVDGIATNLNQTVPIVYSNNGDGTITRDCFTCDPQISNIITGGSRGDFDLVGADDCLYATQTDSVIKVTNDDPTHSCRPGPLGQLYESSPSISTQLFTSNGASISVGSAVAKGTSVFDTAEIHGNGTTSPSDSVTYSFYPNAECSGSGTNQIVTLSSGLVPNSGTQPKLANGDYSFQATYNGPTFFPSTSSCEWFTVGSDFNLDNSGTISATQGLGSGSNTITATLTNGTSSSISFSCSAGLPSGASCSFNPSSGLPSITSTLTITTSSLTPAGSFTITVSGIGGGLTRMTRFLLRVISRGGGVGGVAIPIDKLALLAPFIGIASVISAAVASSLAYRKQVRRKVPSSRQSATWLQLSLERFRNYNLP